MHQTKIPEDMTPAELFQDVARLLAARFLRLEKRSCHVAKDASIHAETPQSPNDIELSEVVAVKRIASI